MTLAPLNPVFALVGLTGLLALGYLVGKIVPFYRRELVVEDASRLTPLDGLRGLLCFSVLFHHAAVTRGYFVTDKWELPPSSTYLLLGQEAVALFFCITGYLFWTKAIAENGEINYWTFQRARLFRVAPMYLFSCAAAISVVARKVHWTSKDQAALIGRMLALGIMQWGKVGRFEFNDVNAAVTWTLKHEWRFYLLLPIAAVLLRWRRPRWAVALASIAFFVGIGMATFFMIGMIAAHAARRKWLARLLRARVASIVCLAALAFLPMAIRPEKVKPASSAATQQVADTDATDNPKLSIYNHVGFWLTAVIFLPIACGNTMFGLLTFSGARLLGMISYSVYLMHGIVLYACRPLLQSSGLNATHPEIYWASIGLLAVGVLALSLCTYAWVELPFIEYERRLRRRRTPPTAPEVVAPIQAAATPPPTA